MENAVDMASIDGDPHCCAIEMDGNVIVMDPEIKPHSSMKGIEENFPIDEIIPFDRDLNIEPCVGLEFESEEAAYAFYGEYARRVGFFIRKKSTRYSRRDKTLIATQYVCSKEGFKRSSISVKNPRADTREGCRAMIRVKKSDTGKWIVHVVEKEHNHALVGPISMHYIQSLWKKLENEPEEGEDELKEMCFTAETSGLEYIKVEPHVGMEFDSEESSFLFYKEYARRAGFSIRKRSTRYSKRTRALIATQYVCSKEGFKLINDMVKHPRPITREGCKAMVKVKRADSGKWSIHFVEKDHNHELFCPTIVHNAQECRKYTNVSNHSRSQSGLMSSRVMSNSSFIQQDGESYIGQTQRLVFKKGDAKVIVDSFKRKQAENPYFFYAIEIDEHERMKNIFWADPMSRMAYRYFGDAIMFDTTCATTKCQVPVAPFIGVNHHGEAVLLGCALLADQTMSSYLWTFQTFLDAMHGKQPKSIITVQDGALPVAIREAFPRTHHCLYMWPIQNEVLEKLSEACISKGDLKEEFDKCVYQSESTHDFEVRWSLFVETFGLKENEWLQIFYEDRRQWVPVYLRDAFLAGLSTTEQNKNLYGVFDGFITSEASVREFIDRFDIVLQRQYEKELIADRNSIYGRPCFVTESPLERQAANVYTGEVFKKFQGEVFQAFDYYATKIKEEGGRAVYKVGRLGMEKPPYLVTFTSSDTSVVCSCHMFESCGLLCRHALRVFMAAEVNTMPPQYVLRRWTKVPRGGDAGNGLSAEEKSIAFESSIKRFNDLCQRSLKIAEHGALSANNYTAALKALHDAVGEIVCANDTVSVFEERGLLEENLATTINGTRVDDQEENLQGQQALKRLKTEYDRGPEKAVSKLCSHCVIADEGICNGGKPREPQQMVSSNYE